MDNRDGRIVMRQKSILVLCLIVVSLILVQDQSVFAQKVDTPQTLGIVLTSNTPFNYKDVDGKTVVVGEVANTKSYPVSGIKVAVGFYDANSNNPLETTTGTTILEVIPPFGKSPYMIKSPSPNSAINSVSVNLLGFSSSPEKESLLSFDLDNLKIGEKLSLSGKITNNGKLDSTNTKIYLISYDSFTPPRVLGIATTEIAGAIKVGVSQNFNFNIPHDTRATIFKIVAESKDYTSGLLDITSPSPITTPSLAPKDTTPPKILQPTDIEIDAEDQKGAQVTYGVLGIDDTDQIVKPSCTPSSGSFFAVGDTKVVCSAKDNAGNKAQQVSFTVTVNPLGVKIPEWIKNVAAFWCDDKIDDASFVEGVQYLIDNDIIRVSGTSSGDGSSQDIPVWIKNNACWWSQGQIIDAEFAAGLEFLISQGILRV